MLVAFILREVNVNAVRFLLISNKINLETKTILEIKWNNLISFYWAKGYKIFKFVCIS